MSRHPPRRSVERLLGRLLPDFLVFLGAWMAFARFALFKQPVDPTDLVFWLSMQAGMVAGPMTTYPVNWRFSKSGKKQAM